MNGQLSLIIALLLKGGGVLLVANEIRGLVLAVPVLFGMYQMGGTAMAIWIGFCSLAGIAISVVLPLFLSRKILRYAVSHGSLK